MALVVVFVRVVASPKAKILVTGLVLEILHASRDEINLGDLAWNCLLEVGHLGSERDRGCVLLQVWDVVPRCRQARSELIVGGW